MRSSGARYANRTIEAFIIGPTRVRRAELFHGDHLARFGCHFLSKVSVATTDRIGEDWLEDCTSTGSWGFGPATKVETTGLAGLVVVSG